MRGHKVFSCAIFFLHVFIALFDSIKIVSVIIITMASPSIIKYKFTKYKRRIPIYQNITLVQLQCQCSCNENSKEKHCQYNKNIEILAILECCNNITNGKLEKRRKEAESINKIEDETRKKEICFIISQWIGYRAYGYQEVKHYPRIFICL